MRETPELPAHLVHRLAVGKTRDEPKTLLIAEHSFQGIDTSRQACLAGGVTMCPVQTVTYVSGRSRQSWRDFPPPRIARHLRRLARPISVCSRPPAASGARTIQMVELIGNSPAAARLNGVNVTRVVFSVYTIAGVFYAFAAWQALGRTPIADPSGYQIANLDSITAVVIGGTSLFGGRGSVAGTFIGTLIVVALKNGLTQAGIDSLYQEIATGALVMLAVGADQYLGRGQRA